MRLATYVAAGDATLTERVGLVEGEGAATVVRALPTGATMRDLVAAGLEEVRRLAADAGAPVPLAEVTLRLPLRPAGVRDFVAFEEHVEGVRRSVDGTSGVPDAWYDAPTFYFTNPHALIADGEEAPFPARSVARDFELEVAAVVGREGSSLGVEEAGEAIFGYTIMNDWSARDLQGREMQVGLGPAKGKDFATTLGPWIVTADELGPYADEDGFLALGCTVEVNGVEIGRDLLSNMGWTFPAMVAYASRDSRVVPGDVLGSGTTGNGGCLAELWGLRGTQEPPPLVDGDVVTLHVEGIGSISNRIVSGPPAPALPPFRRPTRKRP
ncbi:fumarylacetoacetate hydrolase family protein [Nocardioides sambongensis]|uniref:fumarylacetoacetate hydrolase family protein n=1 Tax=Nocardioides sambongensis TaxID=2589074 RepID=UPI00112C3FF5|nr:fumarylacetoacetate hydrolase family protein [Nocardioides sambongensis]